MEAGLETTLNHVDFFVSYNIADTGWAEWIGWQLEAAGYRTVVDAWDFRPGGNWVLLMDDACKRAHRIIVVLSPSYLSKGVFTQVEYATFFAKDPFGVERQLVPVMVEPCRPTGLLGSLIPIRLMGANEQQAKSKLLDGLKNQVRPSTSPPFPGLPAPPTFPPAVTGAATDPADRRGPAADRVRRPVPWSAVNSWPQPRWLAEFEPVAARAKVLEVHLVPPADATQLQPEQLADVGNRLVMLGRGCGLFDQTQSVELRANRRFTAAVGVNSPMAGVAQLDTGQCTGWRALTGVHPSPTLLEDHVSELLHLLAQVWPEPASRAGVAAGLSPNGRTSIPGRCIRAAALGSAHREVAEELTACLVRL